MRRFNPQIALLLFAMGPIALPLDIGLPQAAAQVQETRLTPSGELSSAKVDRDPNRPEVVVANWYVDSARGKDSNSGQDINHPFKTIGRLLASNITAGQTIALKAGSHWRETLTIPAANITVTSFGAGRKPLLDASDVINSALWSKVAGTTNVYQVSVPIDADPSITWVNAWEDGKFLVRATSIANCDATPGSYYPSTDTGNGTIPITLYIHTHDGSGPGTNGRLYEYSKRQYAFQSVFPNVRVVGLWTRRNLNDNGSFAITGSGSLAEQTLITDGSKHNAYISPGVS